MRLYFSSAQKRKINLRPTKANWRLTPINLLFILPPAKDREVRESLDFIYLSILACFCVSLIPSALASPILSVRDFFFFFCGSAKDCGLALVPFPICTAKRWTLSSGHATSGSDPRLSELQIRAVAPYGRENTAFFFFFCCLDLYPSRFKQSSAVCLAEHPQQTTAHTLAAAVNDPLTPAHICSHRK